MKLQAAKKGSSIILLTFLVASTLTLFPSTSATSRPTIPEFTVALIDRSYDVPITYSTSTDPYTGKQVTTSNGGYHVTNITIDITIKTQAFTSVVVNGSDTGLYYAVRNKGHFESWVTDQAYADNPTEASSSGYTVITYVLGEDIPDLTEGQMDFEVKALIGFYRPYSEYSSFPTTIKFFAVTEGDWSSTKTITIGETAPAVTQTQTAAPTQSSTVAPTYTANSTISGNEQNFTLDWQTTVIAILVTAVAALVVIVAVLLRKNRTRKGGLYQ